MRREDERKSRFGPSVLDGVIDLPVAGIIQIQRAVSLVQMREIFADEKEFIFRKLSFVEEVGECLFVDRLVLFDESDVLYPHIIEDHLGDIQFLDVLKDEDDVFGAGDLFQEFLDVHIADIISFLIFQFGYYALFGEGNVFW